MSNPKKEIIKIEKSAFDFMGAVQPLIPAPVMPVLVATEASKRKNQSPVTVWMHKDLKKETQLQAISEGTNVTELITEALILLREKRGLKPLDLTY